MRVKLLLGTVAVATVLLGSMAVGSGATVFREFNLGPDEAALVNCPVGSRVRVSASDIDTGRVICPTFTPTRTPTVPVVATPTPIPPTATATAVPPTATSTSIPPTATSTTVPPTPTATTVPIPTATVAPTACESQCGVPRNFCDVTGPWAFCNDYRQLGDTIFEMPFPGAEPTTMDCLDATSPGYDPQMLGGTLPFPCAFSKHEHFMTRMESGSFGSLVLRYHQPVNIPSVGERHIHFDVDIKGGTRNYFRIMLSPDLTKRDSDDRSGRTFPRSYIQAWVRNGNVEGSICRNGVCEGDSYPHGDAFGTDIWWTPIEQRLYGDNVRVPVDIYVSKTTFRMFINGVEKVEENEGGATFAPLNFDTAYLYLSQASYNPCKDGQCSVADQIVHWDNVAFDGPVLGKNSLTPAGYQDVVFNVYGAASCTVKGIGAQQSAASGDNGYTWVTFSARMPEQAVSPSDVVCVAAGGRSLDPRVMGWEIVKPY